DARGTVEIADGAAQKQYEEMLARAALCRHLEQSVEILALEAQDADAIDVAEFALTHDQSRTGNLDGIVTSTLTPAKSFENLASLLAASAAQFRNGDGTGQALHQFTAMTPQKTLIGAGESILRKMANYFKQRRAHVVI